MRSGARVLVRHAAMVLVASICLGVFARAQTAEELVNKNIEAKGGLEKIKAAKTRLTTGRVKGSGRRRGTVAAFRQMNMRPDLIRQNLSMQGMTAVQAYDGSAGWQTQPFRGRKDPELMGEDNLRDLLLAGDFDGPLVDYAAKGNNVEYLGHAEVDGDDALRLKVTLKNGDIIYYYLDPDTYLEIRKEIQQFIRGSVRERVVDLGSYKPVDGVMYPFSISEGPRNNPGAQVITIDKIEVNVAFQDSDFALPASLRTEEKKSGMVGVH
jgi:outer membrane lipoprotein-sorting protein